MRYAIIDVAAGKVINVVQYNAAPSNPPPGFDAGIIAVQSDVVGPDWSWSGTTLVASPAPAIAPLPQTVLSQDLMAQFTVADYSAIKTAIAGSDQFGLMWSAMQAQKDPMLITNARFLAGWNALVQILGQPRMTQIATTLNVTII
jgi:hypothetical protein